MPVLQAIIEAENERQKLYEFLLDPDVYVPWAERRLYLSNAAEHLDTLWNAQRRECARIVQRMREHQHKKEIIR
jgi:hypothetical protein